MYAILILLSFRSLELFFAASRPKFRQARGSIFTNPQQRAYYIKDYFCTQSTVLAFFRVEDGRSTQPAILSGSSQCLGNLMALGSIESTVQTFQPHIVGYLLESTHLR